MQIKVIYIRNEANYQPFAMYMHIILFIYQISN